MGFSWIVTGNTNNGTGKIWFMLFTLMILKAVSPEQLSLLNFSFKKPVV